MPEFYSTGGISFETLKKVAETEITTSGVTSLEFTGLDLDTDKVYVGYAAIANGSISSSEIRVYFNSDTTETHYRNQYLTVDGATISYDRVNDPHILTINQFSTAILRFVLMRCESYRAKMLVSATINNTSDIKLKLVTVERNNTSNITSIRFSSNISGGISRYSRFMLFGVGK